jgi:hypothetical protein
MRTLSGMLGSLRTLLSSAATSTEPPRAAKHEHGRTFCSFTSEPHFPRRFVAPPLPEAVGAAATGAGAVPVAVPICSALALLFCLIAG